MICFLPSLYRVQRVDEFLMILLMSFLNYALGILNGAYEMRKVNEIVWSSIDRTSPEEREKSFIDLQIIAVVVGCNMYSICRLSWKNVKYLPRQFILQAAAAPKKKRETTPISEEKQSGSSRLCVLS